jgi:hypothetical protein
MSGNKHVTLDESKGITFFINRGSNYAPKCATGFRGNYYNAHHVVPCTSIQKSLKKFLASKPPEYNKALARFTKWDVNAGTNLIGLPHRLAYELAYGTKTPAQVPVKPQWMMAKLVSLIVSPHLPIHLPTNWGHTDYNEDVEVKLDSIWANLSVEIENHEPVKADDMGGAIQGVSNGFRGLLSAKVGQNQTDWLNQSFAQFRMV